MGAQAGNGGRNPRLAVEGVGHAEDVVSGCWDGRTTDQSIARGARKFVTPGCPSRDVEVSCGRWPRWTVCAGQRMQIAACARAGRPAARPRRIAKKPSENAYETIAFAALPNRPLARITREGRVAGRSCVRRHGCPARGGPRRPYDGPGPLAPVGDRAQRDPAHLLVRHMHGGQLRRELGREGNVVVPDDRHVLRHPQPRRTQRLHGTRGDHIGPGQHRGEVEPVAQALLDGVVAVLVVVEAVPHHVGFEGHAVRLEGPPRTSQPALCGGEFGMSRQHQDLAVPGGQQMAGHRVRAALVVVVDRRRRYVTLQRRPAHQHEMGVGRVQGAGEPGHAQLVLVVVVGAAEQHHGGDALLAHHVDQRELTLGVVTRRTDQ